jgi:hypothetical protein
MLDDAPQSIPPATVSDPTATPATPPEAPKQAPIPFNIGEEFGTASKNLPPLKIILIAVAAVAIIGAVISFVQKPRQKATGAIENVVSAEVPNQNLLMVGVEISIHNQGDKLFLPREIKADLETDSGSFTDQAASAVDFPRYVQAFPALAGDGVGPLQFEKAVRPGGETKGMIIVTFPVTADVLAKRKLLRVTITGPDQLVPLVLTK